MTNSIVIDRRKNGKGKSSENRQKFLRRYRHSIKDAVKKQIGNQNISDIGKSGTDINIDRKDIKEPTFQHDYDTGIRKGVNPGNKHFNAGDVIRKSGEEGEGSGGDSGDGEDGFGFSISRDEFLDMFFEDLELPNMIETNLKNSDEVKWKRAGISSVGIPSNMDLVRSMKQSLGRRFALRKPHEKELNKLQLELEEILAVRVKDRSDEQNTRKLELEELIAFHASKVSNIPFIDNIDLRYRVHAKEIVPVTSAVMFCVDGETEYLSPTGWKRIDQYDNTDVAQYTETGDIQFVEPLQYVEQVYRDDYIRIIGQGIDQRLTENHRFIYHDKHGKLNECLSQNVHQLKSWHKKNGVITSFNYSGGGICVSDNELKIQIAFKADGTYQQDGTNRAQFCFSKQRKIDRLISLLEEGNIEYNTSCKDGRTWIYFSTITRWSKTFDSDWYNANKTQVALIAEEVLYWDGCVSQSSFYAKNKNDVDYVQFIWAASGLGTYVFENGPVWTVRFSSKNTRSLTTNTKITSERPDMSEMKSYCFTVPSGMLLLRRNDNIFVSGNCLMDVSGSMGEHEKDLAKRFFTLLHLFLDRNYDKVDVRFIRHHHDAREVDEQEFFHARDSGGTIVSKVMTVMRQIIDDHYSEGGWNIYAAQASDGDNFDNDVTSLSDKMVKQIIPKVQYFAYIEVGDDGGWRSTHPTSVWKTYEPICKVNSKMDMAKVTQPSEIYPVFRKLFKKAE